MNPRIRGRRSRHATSPPRTAAKNMYVRSRNRIGFASIFLLRPTPMSLRGAGPAACAGPFHFLRSRYPDRVRCREFDTCNLGTERYVLQAWLRPRFGRKAQPIPVVQHLLQIVQVRLEAHRALQAEKDGLASRSVR